ncbi:peripheral-type benzodiazepine receptor-associated protein 1 isoform X4 [Crotalus tigris]|uniref:peripheral-type benzodiazepine receptor-associated protein 1 isoform X4 n=1 Tax=Crotalus tigris TaxID=88082 RepID=UPI00192F308E|nr:peripheral-type benzodiazepine receptor-associated protein 1 isoform X4 [Crotalus tigris]
MKRQGWGKPNAQLLQDWARSKTGDGAAERGGHLLVGAMPESAGSPGGAEGTQTALELEVPSRGSSPCSEQVPGSTEVYPAEGLEGCPGEAPVQYGVSYPCILRQNQVLLTALEELQIRCASLKKENNLLRKTCFPETQEKVRHLKRKNAELAVIAKRLEERARKLQEANLRVVNAPINVKSSCAGLCKRALARQRATDLQEQANALLMKDKQINALQRECQELQAKIMGGKEGPPCLPLLDFQHLLQESQKEVLRLQRQIAVKNFKAALEPGGQGSGDISLAFAMNLGLNTSARTTCSNGFSLTRVSQPWEELCIAVEETNQSETGVFPFARVQDREETLFSAPEVKEQVKHLESELTKKRKQCELLEHEVKKKHKRCAELEIELQEVRSDNARLSEENAVLQGQVEWTEKVESENADLRLQVSVVTEERDLALQKTQELQDRLESLGQALKHMRDVAERRQQLEHQHEKALQALQKKKDEVRQLQQAQAEARKEHEGAVQLLEARVRELENQCRSHTEQFNFLSQELSRFRLQTGKLGLPSTSSFCSSLVTSEIVFATCQNSPQFSDGFKQKDPEIVPVSPWRSRKVQNEDVERFSPVTVRFMDPVVSPVARSPDTSSPPVASKKSITKLEAQSSSSRSESMHNSPKSCPTPEVDTASEMEELDTDSISLVPEQENHDPVKLQVFLARYSYNPFDGPNENPEAELPLTAGEYIYVYGEMDEDGFFEGELMDGRRGLVPSNFVERLADDDLVTFLPQELHDLSQSSPLERSFLSISVSSGERSDYSSEELNASTLRLEGDQGEGGISIVVPYPRKVTLIKQFASSLLVTWDPPLVPSGSCLDVQSYNVYVDTELRENVKASSQMKAMIDKLDLKTKAYRISIQSISEKGSSDRLQCTFLVGCGFVLAPSHLQVRNVKATSVELSWMSSNSNFPHTIYLNGGACDIVKAGIYWYTFRNLNPNTSYIATVEVQPQQTFWKPFPEVEEQGLSTEIQFTTSSAGSPDAPLDVRVDPGPTSGILVISWLPVTIDAEGSSNGVRVTGYAVYADGQKVMEVTSPTAGSVLIEISQLQILQLCQEVTVRTVSLYGESVDSVPAQIPFTLLKEVDHSSASQLHCHPSRLLGGEAQALLVTQISQVPGKELPSATKNSVAKLTLQPTITSEKSGDHVHSETSSNIKAPLTPVVQAVSPELGTLPREEENYLLPPAGSVVKEDLAVLRKATKEESGEDNQELLLTVTKLEPHVSDNSANSLETCESCSAEQGTNLPSEREPDNNQSSLEPKILTTDIQEEDGTREMGQNEGQTPESLVESSGKMKLLKEGSRDDSSQLMPKIRREQGEKRSDPGNRPLNLLTDHNRGSDLSDITEEEEEEDEREEEEEKPVPGRPGEMKRNPSEYCSRENGDKLDLGDTDSDEEILERILEMPLQKNCSKALFSIPEVTEEEEEQEQEDDDDEGWEPVLKQPISIPLEKKTMESFQSRLPNHTRRMQGLVCSWSKRNHNLSELILPEKTLLQKYRGGCMNETSSCSVRWDGEDMTYQWDDRKKTSRSPLLEWRRSSHCKERTRVPPQGHRKQKGDIREPSVSMRSNSYYTGGGLYRAQSLTENLDVITSLEVEDDLKLCSWARQRPDQVPPRRMMPQEKREIAVQGLPRCLSPENLEIDIEYDSNEEEDLTITSTPVSLLSSDGRADGSPTDCEEEWSDCSSQSGSVQSSGRRELKRSSSWEGESTDWSISPSHSPGHCGWRKKVNVAPEEWNRTREKSPSVLGVKPEQAWKEGPLVQTWVTGSPRLLDSTSYQSPVQRSRRSARKSQGGTAPLGGTIGTWRSPSLESADDKGSARLFVALFDYDPVSMSPNRDTAEEELPFQEGQILKIYGHKDADGFYRGECAGRTGFIPCNMVSELRVDNDSARKQLLEEGHIATDMLTESLGNGALSPPPLHPSNRPSKPRRSKKEAVRVEDQVPDLEAPGKQNPSSEDPVRTMVAIFDYNPQENSPNSDTEVELRFCAGDVVTVLSSMDDDGFYYGEVNGQKGLVPSNFLEALPSDRAQASEPSLGKQVRETCCLIGTQM